MAKPHIFTTASLLRILVVSVKNYYNMFCADLVLMESCVYIPVGPAKLIAAIYSHLLLQSGVIGETNNMSAIMTRWNSQSKTQKVSS